MHSQVRRKKDKSLRYLKQRNNIRMEGKANKVEIHEVFRPGRDSKDLNVNKTTQESR